jgi:predicted GNAT family acetyltransferase
MKNLPESPLVVHNESQNRFEIALGKQVAFAEYRIDGNRMVFTYTEVPPPFRGQGIAKKLVLAGFDVASKRNLQIVPLCSYVARVLQDHPEFRGLQEKEKFPPIDSESNSRK